MCPSLAGHLSAELWETVDFREVSTSLAFVSRFLALERIIKALP